ncbi:flagellar protein FlgN [Exiguobacterium flavidum]|uniref:flagellar protein FlgN n=1 Tax=Exiguobacterium flavidum TaxID=2184695 RepID=UPI000DF7E744|nr:flagellar protein FlgN [Exiguobacterium flavidum]
METIKQLNEAHEALLALAREKTEVLIRNDMPRLSEIVKEEPVLAKRIISLEEERIAMMGAVSMTEWLADHPENTDVLRDLVRTLGELKRINELNAELLTQSLHYLDWHLQLLIPEADDFTYGQSAIDKAHFNRNA